MGPEQNKEAHLRFPLMRWHRHRAAYWLTPTVMMDGHRLQPVRFRRCGCGHPMEPKLTPTGKRMVRELGWSFDQLCKIAAKAYLDIFE